MQRPIVSFRRITILSLFAGVICGTGFAASLGSVSATAGANSCSQTGAAGVSCSVSNPAGPNGPATASGLTMDTWGQVNGRLEATSNAFGPSTSSSAMVSYSNMLIVTGATGSGDLTIEFTGFQDILSMSPAGGTVSQLMITLGANSTQVTFPFSAPTTFSAVLPANFGVLLPFSLSFSDTANGTIFMGGAFGHGNADAALTAFPSFVVTDANGRPIPGTVQFLPEPATYALLLCAVPALWIARRSAVGVRV